MTATAEKSFCEKCSDWFVGDACPRCAQPTAPEPTPEEQLKASLSGLIRTVWDTFMRPMSNGQWECLSDATAESVKLLQRLDGQREHCNPPPAPHWTADGTWKPRRRTVKG